MTFHSRQLAFLNDGHLPLIASADALDIPGTSPAGLGEQGYDLRIGEMFIILDPRRKAYGQFIVESWHEGPAGQPRFVLMKNVVHRWTLMLTDWQIAHLEQRGRLRPAALQRKGSVGEATSASTALSLTPGEKASARRYLGFVRACLDASDGDRLTKAAVLRAAEAHAATLGMETPCYNTLKLHIQRFLTREGAFDPLVALAPRRRPGFAGPRLDNQVERFLAEAVEVAWRDLKGSWRTARTHFERLAEENGIGAAADGCRRVALPSDRTFQRRFAQVDGYTRDVLRYGEGYAAKRHAAYIRRVLPEFPLDIVDVDHATADIFVIDDEVPTAFGRPDIIAFRDRATGCILGLAIGFEGSSYVQFLNGLRHAIFPKDMSAYPHLTWAFHGRFRRLGVDNAMHFIGDNIHHAAAELGFDIVEYRPGEPWLKGALERLFGVINVSVLHRLPGATFSSPQEREKYEERKLAAMPVLTLAELRAFLFDYICRIYHHEPHEGLGMLRTLSGVPEHLWAKGIAAAPPRQPIDPEIFTRLAGDVDRRTIQPIGIEWDYITYQSAELRALAAHPSHLPGSGRHDATKYKVTRDPNDLGRIWIDDPYRRVAVEVPACDADRAYATNLSLTRHRALIQYQRDAVGRVTNTQQLAAARRDFEETLEALGTRRRKAGTGALLARFVAQQARRIERSTVVRAEDASEGGRLDLAEPPVARARGEVGRRRTNDAAPDASAPPARAVPPRVAAESTASLTVHPDGVKDGSPTSIDDLRMRHADWDV